MHQERPAAADHPLDRPFVRPCSVRPLAPARLRVPAPQSRTTARESPRTRRLSNFAGGSMCSRWQNSQSFPLVHAPVTWKRHGRAQRNGWPAGRVLGGRLGKGTLTRLFGKSDGGPAQMRRWSTSAPKLGSSGQILPLSPKCGGPTLAVFGQKTAEFRSSTLKPWPPRMAKGGRTLPGSPTCGRGWADLGQHRSGVGRTRPVSAQFRLDLPRVRPNCNFGGSWGRFWKKHRLARQGLHNLSPRT